jgi:LysR family transcriptional regulator, transcriptional activator of the cysJI operon
MIDFNLKVFLAAAKMGSFTRASEFLNLSQPAVTHQIKNLEKKFMAKLFNRTQNKVELTNSGEILLKYAEEIDHLYWKATQEILDATNQVAGEVHIGVASLLGKFLLPRIMGNFKKTYPAVTLSMLVGNSREILEFLENGMIELAIVSEPITSRNLKTFLFFRDHLAVVVYPKHPWCRKKQVLASDLFKEDFISREVGSGTREVYTKALEALQKGGKLRPAMVLGSTESVKMAVIGEMGFAVTSRLAIRSEVELGLLKEVQVKDLDMKRDFFVAFKSEKDLSVPSMKLKDYLKTIRDLRQY